MTAAPAPTRSGAGATRVGHVDDLKVALTAGVITAHAAITYGAEGSWFYDEAGDDGGTLGAVLTAPLAIGALFGMGLFFFLAGAFTPDALERKGTGRFLADRWVRLGVPFAAFVLAVVPLVQWLADAGSGADTSAAEQWRVQLEDLDAGPLWFVGVLLLFSTVNALAARRWRAAGRRPLTGRLVLGTMAGIAVVSFVVRLAFPLDSPEPFQAHVWQWGQCAGLFVLGLHAGRHGWFAEIPAGLRRRCGWAFACAGAVVVLLVGLQGDDLDPLAGGLTWQSAVLATAEGVLATAAAVVLTDLFRDRRRGRVAAAAARAAYGAYILQAPVLVAFALLLRDTGLPPALKFAVVATAAVAACFTLSAAVGRLPGVRLVLRTR